MISNINTLIWSVSTFVHTKNGFFIAENAINLIKLFNRVSLQFNFAFLNQKSGKMNTLYFLGEPNGGKTCFATLRCEASINFGYISALRENSSFPFHSCTDKRILNHCSVALRWTVAKKCSSDSSILRRSVIICAKHYCLPEPSDGEGESGHVDQYFQIWKISYSFPPSASYCTL